MPKAATPEEAREAGRIMAESIERERTTTGPETIRLRNARLSLAAAQREFEEALIAYTEQQMTIGIGTIGAVLTAEMLQETLDRDPQDRPRGV